MPQIDNAFEVIDGLGLDDEVLIYYTFTDPSVGGGYDAPLGSLLCLKTNGDWYHKTDTGDTDWEIITGASADEELGHIVKIEDGITDQINEDRQLLHCGSFCIDGELILDGELCLI